MAHSSRTSKPAPRASRRRAPSGRFVVLDGPDGVGKTTQLRRLAEELERSGRQVLSLREPGGTQAGEVIRGLLLARQTAHLTAAAEALLFQAARAQLVAEAIRPALARGVWVLCDRFSLSTAVYQGAAGGVGKEAVEQLTALATGGLKPELYLVLWAPPRVCLSRREDRAPDRMESKGAAYLRRVSRAFRQAALAAPDTYRLVDASGAPDEVAARIWSAVAPLL